MLKLTRTESARAKPMNGTAIVDAQIFPTDCDQADKSVDCGMDRPVLDNRLLVKKVVCVSLER